ncbi:lysoplasmalogenase [Vibrio sp. TRT 21S02]|uniref:lysoplasmalogenase n=1 Tax=unclassified Vibrio TaxID=2614977 RepID=UPI00349F73F2
MWSWLSVALAGFISISASENNNKFQAATFKTLTLSLLLFMLLTQAGDLGTSLVWIAGGLIVSMLADALYIFRRKQRLCFAFFLLAQLSYSKFFWLQLSGDIVWWLPAMLLGAAVVAFFLLLPKIDRFIFPVVIMGMVLIQLNWAAGEVWLLERTSSAALAFAGTLTLTASAAVLALHDYRHSIALGQYLISGSYLLAHALITASLII